LAWNSRFDSVVKTPPIIERYSQRNHGRREDQTAKAIYRFLDATNMPTTLQRESETRRVEGIEIEIKLC